MVFSPYETDRGVVGAVHSEFFFPCREMVQRVVSAAQVVVCYKAKGPAPHAAAALQRRPQLEARQAELSSNITPNPRGPPITHFTPFPLSPVRKYIEIQLKM